MPLAAPVTMIRLFSSNMRAYILGGSAAPQAMRISRALRDGGLVCALVAATASAADWTPSAYTNQATLELRTVAPGEREHWFKVWLGVLHDQPYVPLGPRAAPP